MKALLVSRELAPFFGGGIATYAATMAGVLAEAGHEVHVLAGPHEGVERGELSQSGVRVHTVDLEAGRAGVNAYPAYSMRYSMAVLEALERLCGRDRFDYIEFPDYNAEGYFAVRAKRTLGKFAGSVLAVRLHSASWLCARADRDETLDVERVFLEHLERTSIGEADAIVSPGRRVLEKVREGAGAMRSINWMPREVVVPIPVDIERVTRELGDEEEPTPEVAEVLFFGKLQYLKGPQDLAAAAVRVLERGVRARFRFIGNDSRTGPFGKSMLEHVKGRIPEKWRGAFVFEPARARARLGGAVRAATRSGGVCCFPSRWEAFPMVCLEAMALGAPVVCSDAGGLGEIVEHEVSGVVARAGDVQALAAGLERVLKDEQLRDRIARAGRERVARLCEPRRVVGEIEDLVRRQGRADTDLRTKTPADRRQAEPSVSIVIPCYNMGRYLPETLESVRRQTRRDFEIVVIDDGSTEPETIELLKGLGPDVRVVRKENGGLSSARNAGLREARGEWIVPLDADDLIDPTTLEKAIAVAEAHPELAYVSPLASYFEETPERNTGGWVPLGPDRDLLLVRNIGGAASGSLIRREAALAVGGYDEWMTSYEDWDFWCRLAGAGYAGVVIPEFLLHYRVRADSMFRTVATSRHTALHAYILARHAGIATDPSRAMRVFQFLADYDPHASAMAIIKENIRYRFVDTINDALKRAGMQRALKGLTAKVLRAGRRAGD